MSAKPSYLGLLNAVAIGESQAHAYLTEWIKVCEDDCVRDVLATVAAREGEHGMAFAKRINELGYSVLEKDDPSFAGKMAIAAGSGSDLEKMERLGLGRLDPGEGQPDIFDGFFKDHSIDIRTGELLGRYIAEERDSARLLRCCYEQLRDAAGGADGATASSARSEVARLEGKVDALCEAVDELRGLLASSLTAGNGKSTVKAGAKR